MISLRPTILYALLFTAWRTCVFVPNAIAQVNLDRVYTHASSRAFFNLDTATTTPSSSLEMGIGLDVSRDLLVVRNPMDSQPLANGRLVGQRLAMRLAASYGLSSDVSLVVGLTLAAQRGDAAPGRDAVESVAIGDIELGTKVALWRQPGTIVSGVLSMTLPTGAAAAYLGDAGLSASAKALLERKIGDLTLAAQLGYRLRRNDAVMSLVVGDELIAGFAVRNEMFRQRMWIGGELTARIGVGQKFSEAQRPCELMIGAGGGVAAHWALQFGIGTGLNQGYGAPELRGLLSLHYRPSSKTSRRVTVAWTPDDANDEDPPVRTPPPPEQPPVQAALADIRVENGRIVLPESILFDVGQAELRADATAMLAKIVERWRAEPTWVAMSIVGHSDARGDAEQNLGLSQRRADAVRNALIALGATSTRVTATGYGERDRKSVV